MIRGYADVCRFPFEHRDDRGDNGTHRGDFYGIPATGRYVQYKTADIARIKDGLIAEHWDVVDQYTFLQGLGVIPEE